MLVGESGPDCMGLDYCLCGGSWWELCWGEGNVGRVVWGLIV